MGEAMPGFDKVATMRYPELERITHIHHAGNSSGIVDGSAAVLVGNREFGAQWGLTPRARIRATAKIGTDPTIMLTGPVPVTEKILREAGMAISDIDLFEVNEAFAAVVLRFMQAFDVEADKVNVNGGAIAMGHPLGATGAIIIGTLAGRAGAHRQGHRPGDAVHRLRHGRGNDHRAGLMPRVDPALAPSNARNGCATRQLSVAGGITQFGAYVDTLQPGGRTSERHWHSAEDEFLYVLEGRVTLQDDAGLHDLGPGDAVCWPHGAPNAHRITNRGEAPTRHLVMGTRVAGDICRYPDSGRTQINGETRWQIVERDGSLVKEGDLPPELLNLPPVWGTPFSTPAAQHIQRAEGRQWVDEGPWQHPVLGAELGRYRHAILGDPGGLSQFGAHLEALPPGSSSSLRHWHEGEDEMILMLTGAVVLIEEVETALGPGDAACWPAGRSIGHCLQNRSTAEAIYLTLGTRKTRDVIHYPDHDLITVKDGAARTYLHGDGTAYVPRRKE